MTRANDRPKDVAVLCEMLAAVIEFDEGQDSATTATTGGSCNFFFIRRSIRFRMMIIICYCSLWPAREPRSISFSELVKIRLRGVRHWQRGTCFWLCDHRFFFALSRIITSCSLIIRTEADGVYVCMRLYVCFDRLESARGLRSRRSWSRVTRFDGQFKIHRHKAIKAETLLMIFNSFSSLFD